MKEFRRYFCLLLWLALSPVVYGDNEELSDIDAYRGAILELTGDGTVYITGRSTLHTHVKGDGKREIPGFPKIRKISGSIDHIIAIDMQGCLWGWGDNRRNQLGFLEGDWIKTPTKASMRCNLSSVETSRYRSMVATDKKQFKIWGSDIPEKMQGVSRSLPNDATIQSINASGLMSVITDAGALYALGSTAERLFPQKFENARFSPKRIEVPCAVKEVNSSIDALFVCRNGAVYAIGPNVTGSLGLGHNEPVKEITKNTNLQNVLKIVGSDPRIALTSEGQFWGWGDQVIGSSEWTNSFYVEEPITIEPPEESVDVYSDGYTFIFRMNRGSYFKMVAEEHWLFPIKLSLEDYHFEKLQ